MMKAQGSKRFVVTAVLALATFIGNALLLFGTPHSVSVAGVTDRYLVTLLAVIMILSGT